MKHTSLTILTFNVQGVPSFSKATLSRLTITAKKLNQTTADIINLQEVFTYQQLKIIKSGLKDYPFFTIGRGIIGPQGGLVTFSKTPLSHPKFIPFSFFGLLKPGFFKIFRRNILSDKGLLLSKTVDNLIIINTHLIANPVNDWSPSSRFYSEYKKQIAKIGKTIASIKNCTAIITTGDFNIPQNSQLYQEMIKQYQSQDVFTTDQQPTFHKAFLPPGESGHRLDFIFIKPQQLQPKVTQKARLFSDKLLPDTLNRGYISDHMALISTIFFEPK